MVPIHAGDGRAWKYKSYKSSEWDGSKWSTPTAKFLSASDYDTDRDWHARTMRYGEGWAHDPTYSQQKRAKPTHTDPEDDMQTDPLMPIGSTSKTWNPGTDGQFLAKTVRKRRGMDIVKQMETEVEDPEVFL